MFNLQFMLDTTLSDQDRYPLKINDLVIMSVNKEYAPEKVIWSNSPEYVITDLPCVGFNGDRYHRPAQEFGDYIEYTGSVMFVDPSGTGKDQTAISCVKMLNGNLFVTECFGLSGGYSNNVLERIARTARDNKINKILIEQNFGGGMFSQLLQPFLLKHHTCEVEDVRNTKTKEMRIIDTLEPVMNSHRLIIDRKVMENDFKSNPDDTPERRLKLQLAYQISRLSKNKGSLVHDDLVDSLAGAVGYWTEYMAQTEDMNIAKRHQELIHTHLDNWGHVLNNTISQAAMGMTPQQIRNSSVSDGGFLDNL